MSIDDRKDLPPTNAPNFSERLRETLSTYLGHRGDKLDRGLTLRDLTEAGIVKLRNGFLDGTGGSGSPVQGPGSAITSPLELDLTPPPTPTGFNVGSAISSIFIEHDAPFYTQGHGHAKTVVYGAKWVGGPLPVFAKAVNIAEFVGTVFSYPTDPSTTWHLWIKWVSVDGVASVAPAGGTNGLVAITGQDVSLLLNALAGQITDSQLFGDLGRRINLIDGTEQGSVNARLIAEALDRTTAITELSTIRETAEGVITQRVTQLNASLNTNLGLIGAAINNEITARGTAIDAEASQRVILASDFSTNRGLALAAAVIEQTARTTAEGAIASSVSQLSASFNTNLGLINGAINNEITVRANAIEAEALERTVLSASVQTRPNLCPDVDKWNNSPDLNITSWGLQATKDGLANGNYVWVSPTMPAQANATYVITGDSLMLFNTGGSGIVYFDLIFYDASGGLLLDGPQKSMALEHDFSTDNRSRLLHSVQCTAPANTSFVRARFVAENLVNSRVVGFRQVKVERGSLPATFYTQEGAVGNLTSAIQVESIARASQTGELYAQYTVKTDVAGLISGFGLASTASNASVSSAFGIRANRFFLSPPSFASATNPGTNPLMYDQLYVGFVWINTSVTPNLTYHLVEYERSADGVPTVVNFVASSELGEQSLLTPFVVQTTPVTIKGVVIPPGVYIANAFIKNATITRAKIGKLEVDDAHITELNVVKLTAGFLKVGAYISSANYKPGVSGFFIPATGLAEFSDVIVRGTVYATAGLIGGNTINASGIESPGFAQDSAGWRLNSDGSFYANTGNFRGSVNTGNFTSYNWPATGGGSHLSASGLLVGNYNLGKYFQLTADGNLLAPQFSIINGVATFSGALNAASGSFSGALVAASGSFSGTLTADAINAVRTINLAGNSVTVMNSASGSAANIYTNLNVPANEAMKVVIMVYKEDGYASTVIIYVDNVFQYSFRGSTYLYGANANGDGAYNQYTCVTGLVQVTIPAGAARTVVIRAQSTDSQNGIFDVVAAKVVTAFGVLR